MPKESWPINQHHITQAETAMLVQAKHHGLDINDPTTHNFIQHMSLVQASMIAESQWLRKIIDSQMGRLNQLAK